MDIYQDDFFKMWLEDDIIQTDFYCETLTVDIAEKGIQERLKFLTNKPYPMLSDCRKIKMVSSEARDKMSQKDAGQGLSSVAIIVNSKVHEVIYNFFAAINKTPAPTKLFTNKEKALAWLKAQK